MRGVLAFGGTVSSVFAENKTMDKNAGADAIYHGAPIVTMTQE